MPTEESRCQSRRTRTGCFTCRRRRKKCDEAKPTCVACGRSGYICEGYPARTLFQQNARQWPTTQSPAPNHVMTEHTYNSQTSQPAPSPRTNQLLDTSSTVNVVDFFIADQSMQPSSMSDDQNLYDSLFPCPSEIFDSSQPLPPPLQQQQTAADQDEPCDTRAARQPSCVQQDGSSRFMSPHRLVSGHTLPSAASKRRQSRIPRELPYPVNGVETQLDQRFFSHFVNITSRVLTISTDSNNPLLSTILPRSLDDPMILKAILCLGASHILNLQPTFDPGVASAKEALLQAAEDEQVERIGAHKADLAAGTDIARLEAILSCALILCLYEISEGNGDSTWRVRLDVARDLIQDTVNATHSEMITCNDQDEPQIDNFLLEFFTYHDVLAAVTDQSRRPILSRESDASSSHGSPTAYMIGVDNGLFQLIVRVAALASCQSTTTTICEALSIWDDVNNWQPATDDPDKALAFSAYVHALFVWLYSIINPTRINDDRVRRVVEAGFLDMAEIHDSGLLAFLLFPTFVLGFASVTDRERQDCTAQFERLRKFSGLGNVRLAFDVVRSSWTEYDNGVKNTWNWVDNMSRWGVSLPVT